MSVTRLDSRKVTQIDSEAATSGRTDLALLPDNAPVIAPTAEERKLMRWETRITIGTGLAMIASIGGGIAVPCCFHVNLLTGTAAFMAGAVGACFLGIVTESYLSSREHYAARRAHYAYKRAERARRQTLELQQAEEMRCLEDRREAESRQRIIETHIRFSSHAEAVFDETVGTRIPEKGAAVFLPHPEDPTKRLVARVTEAMSCLVEKGQPPELRVYAELHEAPHKDAPPSSWQRLAQAPLLQRTYAAAAAGRQSSLTLPLPVAHRPILMPQPLPAPPMKVKPSLPEPPAVP